MSALLIAALGTLGGSLGAYLLAARRFSGKVETTEASRLWDAAESLRKELTARNEYLRKTIEKLEAKIAGLEGRIMVLEDHNEELHRENEDLKQAALEQERIIAEQRARIKALENENVVLRRDNVKLTRRVEALEEAK